MHAVEFLDIWCQKRSLKPYACRLPLLADLHFGYVLVCIGNDIFALSPPMKFGFKPRTPKDMERKLKLIFTNSGTTGCQTLKPQLWGKLAPKFLLMYFDKCIIYNKLYTLYSLELINYCYYLLLLLEISWKKIQHFYY